MDDTQLPELIASLTDSLLKFEELSNSTSALDSFEDEQEEEDAALQRHVKPELSLEVSTRVVKDCTNYSKI